MRTKRGTAGIKHKKQPEVTTIPWRKWVQLPGGSEYNSLVEVSTITLVLIVIVAHTKLVKNITG